MIDISKHNLRLVPEGQIDFQKLNRIQDLESENKALKNGLIISCAILLLLTGVLIIDSYSQEKKT